MRQLLFAAIVFSHGLAWAAEIEVEIHDFYFDPEVVELKVGDTLSFVNREGGHNVVARDGSFDSGPVQTGAWRYSVTLASATDELLYDCTAHPGHTGALVVGESTSTSVERIHTGTWWNPDMDGQGMFIDVLPERREAVVLWFTFDELGGPAWISAQGPIVNGVAELTGYQGRGGVIADPAPTTLEEWGQVELRFTSCTAGELSFVRSDGFAGSTPIARLTPVSCEEEN